MYKIENHKVSAAARVGSHLDEAGYERMYRQSLEQPDQFWAEQAERFLTWDQPWSKVQQSDLSKGEAAWFIDGKLNVSVNCIDRHLAERGDTTAIIWATTRKKQHTSATANCMRRSAAWPTCSRPVG